MSIGYTPGQLTPAQAESKPGGTHDSGIRYPGLLSDRSTPLTKTQDWMQILELLYRRGSLMMGLHCERTDNALEVAVYGGVYAKSDGTKVTFAEHSAFSVPDDTADHKLWVLASTNVLTGGASWPGDSTTYVAVAMVTTASGAVTEIKDARPYNSLRIVPTYTDNGQTAQSEFLIDADATVAGDRYLSMQLGAALWAALKWANTGSRFELYSDKDTTLAKLNLLEVLISGTKLLDSDGAAKVASAVAGGGLAESSGVLSVGVDGATIEIDSDALRIKDLGVTTAKLNNTLQDYLAKVSVADANGSSPQTISVQVQDAAGNAYSGVVYVEVGVYDDADLQTESVNATIADGGSGSFLDALTTNKVYRAKTDSAGLLQVAVTAPTGTYYLGIARTRGSKHLDCSDIGTITIT